MKRISLTEAEFASAMLGAWSAGAGEFAGSMSDAGSLPVDWTYPDHETDEWAIATAKALMPWSAKRFDEDAKEQC